MAPSAVAHLFLNIGCLFVALEEFEQAILLPEPQQKAVWDKAHPQFQDFLWILDSGADKGNFDTLCSHLSKENNELEEYNRVRCLDPEAHTFPLVEMEEVRQFTLERGRVDQKALEALKQVWESYGNARMELPRRAPLATTPRIHGAVRRETNACGAIRPVFRSAG